MNKKLKKLFALILLVSLLFTACAPPNQDTNDGSTSKKQENTEKNKTDSAANSKKEPKILRMSITGEPSSLDVQDGSDTLSSFVRTTVNEYLIRNQNGEYIPGIAEDWNISDDGLVYTFNLRKDAKWADGEPVTAEQFVYGAIRLIDPNPPAPMGGHSFYGFCLVNGEEFNKSEITDPSLVGVKALDEYTVQYTLKNPVAYFMNYLSSSQFAANRKDYTEKYKEEFATEVDKFVGNGPYVLTEWKHEQSLTFEKNQNYWNKDAINFDKVEMLIISDANTALNMYENGEIDFVNIPKDMIPKYEQEKKAILTKTGGQFWLEFNMDSPRPEVKKFISNKNFRKAIGHAIDREQYVKALLNDGSIPAFRYCPDVMIVDGELWGEKYPMQWYPKNADIKKAEEYLQMALDEIGATKEEIPMIKFLTDDRPDRKLSAEAIQDMVYKNLGIQFDIELVQTKQRYEMMENGQFDIVWAGLSVSNPDPAAYLERLTSTNGLNETRYASPAYDELIKKSQEEPDQQKRAEILYEAEKLIMDEGPLVPIYNPGGAWTKREDLINIYKGGMIPMDPDFIFADFKE